MTSVGGLTRKEMLGAAGAAALVAAGSGLGSPRRPPAAAAAAVSDWGAVKAQFALDYRRRQFASFLLSPHSAPVREAIDRHRRGLDAAGAEYLHARGGDLDRAVANAAAEHLGVAAEEIAFTDSTTMGLALLYSGLRLRDRDEIVTTEHDHYSTHESLRLSGHRVRRIRLYRDPAKATVDRIVAAVRRGIGPRTRVLAVTWVHSSTGVKLPLREIAAALPERVLLCVDGVHGLGAEPARMRDLGCDAFVAGTHKWLGGPRGTGLVWATPRVWRRVKPLIPPFGGGSPGAVHTPGGYHSFEHRWALADAFAFQRAIGQEPIAARIHALAARLKAGLGARVVTPADAAVSAGIICCAVDRPRDVVRRLAAEHGIVASVTPYATEYLRLGTSLTVDEADVDAAIRAVAAVA